MSALARRWERIGAAMPPRKRMMRRQGRHSLEFKMQVVQYALSLPEGARIKPTCRQFQNIAPVQVRKWLRAYAYKHTSPLSAELGDEGGHLGQFGTAVEGGRRLLGKYAQKDSDRPRRPRSGQRPLAGIAPWPHRRAGTATEGTGSPLREHDAYFM